MKYQSLFPEKKKKKEKNIIGLSSAEIAQRRVRVIYPEMLHFHANHIQGENLHHKNSEKDYSFFFERGPFKSVSHF